MKSNVIQFPTKLTRAVSIEPLSAIDLAKCIRNKANQAAKEGVAKHKAQRQAYYDSLSINIALKALYPLTTRGKNDTTN